MYYKIFLLLFLASPIITNAQKPREKYFINAKYECRYSFKFVEDTIQLIMGREDEFLLKIGDNFTYGYSYRAHYIDSINQDSQSFKAYFETMKESLNNGTYSTFYRTSCSLVDARLYKNYLTRVCL